MEAVRASSVHSLSLSISASFNKTHLRKPIFNPNPNPTQPISSSSSIQPKFTVFTATSPTVTADEAEIEPTEKFEWFSQWYPLMPVCDLDKKVPHAKKVLGLDVVLWWDRNESAWKVFDDSCPHRLAPLSEGRIDQWGRLQCVYHGWCFNGSGDCNLIPQAPQDGPPVHTFKKACAVVYPSTVQNGIVWFWPNSDPQYKDILVEQKPPYIPELDDPSFTKPIGNREIPYGYEVLIENLMDPAHVPYAHYGIMRIPNQKKRVKVDREGGRPIDMRVDDFSINGFTGKQEFGSSKFIPPCVYYAFPNIASPQTSNGLESSGGDKENSASVAQRRALLIFICIPVSPGRSRLIWTFPRNFAVWIDQVVPRWMFHVGQNLILDSDLYLLHEEEKKIKEIGPSNWQKVCFVPTKSDAYVVNFRRWLNKYSGGQVDWRGKFSGELPPSPPREQLLDRYWSHVVNCSSCRVAHKGLNVLEVALQIIAIASVGVVAAMRHSAMPPAARTSLVVMSVLCFAASKWLSHFIYKTFHFHDYNHALR